MTESIPKPVTAQLEDALENIQDPDARYHLRECIQLLKDDHTDREQKA